MSVGAFIPNRIKNKTVVRVLEFMRRFGRRFHIAWRTSDRHSDNNRLAIRSIRSASGDHPKKYLENQNRYTQISYGKSDMAYAGCEIIAVYNALFSLGEEADLHALIREFERDGMVLGARFGTAPYAIRDSLIKRGYNVITELNAEHFDETADASDVLILMLYNDRRSIFRKIHTICITQDDRGYTAHNTYGDGRTAGPAPSVSELIAGINEGYAKGIVLFGIARRCLCT